MRYSLFDGQYTIQRLFGLTQRKVSASTPSHSDDVFPFDIRETVMCIGNDISATVLKGFYVFLYWLHYPFGSTLNQCGLGIDAAEYNYFAAIVTGKRVNIHASGACLYSDMGVDSHIDKIAVHIRCLLYTSPSP